MYEAGYAPICPTMYMSSFLGRDIPVEVKDKKDMSDELLKRSRILVVCGDHLNKDVRSDIALAKHCGISYTTLSGILDLAEIDDQP